MEVPRQSTHPMFLIAAGAVTLASLAATAHYAGWMPSRAAEPTAITQVAQAPAPQAGVAPTPTAPTPAIAPPAPVSPPAAAPSVAAPAKPKPRRPVSDEAMEDPLPRTNRSERVWRYESPAPSGSPWGRSFEAGNAQVYATPPATVPAPVYAPPPVCRECGTVIDTRTVNNQQNSPLGALAGGVVGGILGHQVGKGTGRDLATIAGAVGGAVAGNQIEKNMHGNASTQVTVRFDDGSQRSFSQPGDNNWRNGERVRMLNGTLVHD